MASRIDKARVELATAIVAERTAEIELRTRRLQLMAALVKLVTAWIGLLGLLVILALRI